MKRSIAYTLLFIVVLLVAVILNMPAKYALSMASSKTGLFSFDSATGTVFSGSATGLRARVKHQVLDFGKLEWELSPWALLLGEACVDFKNKKSPQDISMEGTAQFNWQKKAKLSDAEFSVPIALLIRFSPMPIKASGDVELSLQSLDFSDNTISNLSGQLLLQDIQTTMSGQLDLGSFAARLSDDNGALVADVTDIDSTIAVSGQAILQQSDLSFETDLTLVAAANAPAMIQQSLPFIARKTGGNTFVIQRSGNL